MKIRAPISTVDTLRFIVMIFGKLTLACRIETVYKVVKRTQIHSSGLGYTGLTYIDDQTATVVDLHYKLFNVSITHEQAYFVIIKSQKDELLAIPVTKAPNLMDIQREHIRVLPKPYRQSDTLAIASHVAVVSHQDSMLTLFVIDNNALL